MRRLIAAIDRYWFAPAALRDLAIVRILIFGSQLVLFLPSLAAQIRIAQADAAFFTPLPALKALLLPLGWGARPSPELLIVVWVVAAFSTAAAALGLFTRLSTLLAAITNTLLVAHRYSYGELHHGEAAHAIMMFTLALAPCGRALSLDALRRRWREARARMRFEPQAEELDPDARWPLRLGQWLLAMIYLSAAASKLARSGLEWLNGYTLTFFFMQDGVRHHSDIALFLAQFPRAAIALSVVALLFELTFFVILFLPRLTWLYLLTGVGLHVGIYVVQRAPFFEFLFLYGAFLEPLRRSWPARLRPAVRAGRWQVLYDGLCPLCIRSMTTLDVLDVSDRLIYVDVERDWPAAASVAHALEPALTPDSAREAMHVVAPDGRVHRGFYAFREIARALPLLWPVLPLLHLPGVPWAGERVYAAVARNRARHGVCRVESCDF